MKIIDADHPFFRPLWRRVAVVVACLAWAVFEFSGGQGFWGMLFAALGLYSGWVLLITFNPTEEEDDA